MAHLEMSGNIFVTLGRRCYWHLMVETRDAAKHSKMHRTALPQERVIWSKMSTVAEVEKPCFQGCLFQEIQQGALKTNTDFKRNSLRRIIYFPNRAFACLAICRQAPISERNPCCCVHFLSLKSWVKFYFACLFSLAQSPLRQLSL